jgi:hypothetical protein
MSTRRCRRAGRTTCATAGGSSTTTASRSTGSCARGCSAGREDLRRLRLGRGAGQIRRAAARGLRGARRRRAARLDRRLPQRGIFRADLHGRRGLAQAADGRSRRPGRRDRADRPAQRRRAGRADGKPRRQLRRDHGRDLRRRSTTTADLLPRLHDQGLGHADRRAQGQPRRADDQGADGRVAAPYGRARGAGMGALRHRGGPRRPARLPRPVPFFAKGRAPLLRCEAVPCPPSRSPDRPRDLDPGGLRQDPRRSGQRATARWPRGS